MLRETVEQLLVKGTKLYVRSSLSYAQSDEYMFTDRVKKAKSCSSNLNPLIAEEVKKNDQIIKRKDTVRIDENSSRKT